MRENIKKFACSKIRSLNRVLFDLNKLLPHPSLIYTYVVEAFNFHNLIEGLKFHAIDYGSQGFLCLVI